MGCGGVLGGVQSPCDRETPDLKTAAHSGRLADPLISLPSVCQTPPSNSLQPSKWNERLFPAGIENPF